MRVFLMAFSVCNNINFCWLSVLFLQYKLVKFFQWTFQVVKGPRKGMKRIHFVIHKKLTLRLYLYMAGGAFYIWYRIVG